MNNTPTPNTVHTVIRQFNGQTLYLSEMHRGYGYRWSDKAADALELSVGSALKACKGAAEHYSAECAVKGAKDTLLQPREAQPVTITKVQTDAALKLRAKRPAVIPGSNVIVNGSQRLIWNRAVTSAMKKHKLVGQQVGLFCDIAGVPD